MATVELMRDAKEDFESLDGSAKKVVGSALVKLQTDPELRGAPLGSRNSGNLTGYRKLVVGKKTYRIIYAVQADGSVCVVWVIDGRSDDECYDLAVSRTTQASEEDRAKLKSILDAAFNR